MVKIVSCAYKSGSVYGSRELTFGDWLYDYWWLILLAVILVSVLIYLLYKQQTRLHSITLYVGKTPTIIQVQHRKTFSAPIPDGEGTFKGWYRDTALSIPYNSSDKVISDISLYAKFE